MRKSLAALAALLSCSPMLAGAQTPIPPWIAAAVASPARTPMMQSRDSYRHPAEVLAFAGVRPGYKVADLIPGTGYFTTLFSLVVGPTGHVFDVWPTEYAKVDADQVPPNTVSGSQVPHLPNATLLYEPARAFTLPEQVDIVFTSQNYHDYPDPFMGPTNPEGLDRAVFAALKPGGAFIIIDHVAPVGSGQHDTNTLHRIDPELVKAEVLKAGFIFEAASGALRNPADDHTKSVFDKSIRGHTDQFMFRFRKPK